MQHTVVSRAQFLGLGLTRHRLRTYMGNGILHRRFPGVYAVGHTRLTQKGLWMAAVLACGEDALLSHRDAGSPLAGLRPVRYTAQRITSEPAAVVAEIRALLDAGA